MPLPGPPRKQTREEMEAKRYITPARVAMVESSRARGSSGLSGPPVRESRLRVESIRYNDPEEVTRAIEELARSSPDMRLLSYGTLRNILIGRGIIRPVSEAVAAPRSPRSPRARRSPRAPRSPRSPRSPRARRSLPRGAVAVSRRRSPWSSPSEILNALSAQPMSLEDIRMQEQEMMSAIDRASLNADRVIEDSAHYREERRIVNQRIEELTREIDNIDRITLRLANPSNRTPSNQSLYDLYALERLQKEEELMRLQDHLQEINKMIQNILRKYEDKRSFVDIVDIRNGGTRRRTRTRTRRHKWSLKYKRSIDCKHPKGFSQRQHCTWGRTPRKPPVS